MSSVHSDKSPTERDHDFKLMVNCIEIWSWIRSINCLHVRLHCGTYYSSFPARKSHILMTLQARCDISEREFLQFPLRTNKSMTLETMSILSRAQRSCQKRNICADGGFDLDQLFIRWDIISKFPGELHQRPHSIPNVKMLIIKHRLFVSWETIEVTLWVISTLISA